MLERANDPNAPSTFNFPVGDISRWALAWAVKSMGLTRVFDFKGLSVFVPLW